MNSHLIEFQSIVSYLSPAEIEDKRVEEGDEIAAAKYRVKDESLKMQCYSNEWQLAAIYLIYENYLDTAVKIEGTREEDGEPNTYLLGQLLEDFEITRSEDDMVLVSELKSMEYGKDRKKMKTELEGIGLVIKKCRVRGSLHYDKMVVVGIKQIPLEDGAEILTDCAY